MGTVTGLDAPQSECSDAKGNVWVDVTDAHQIIKLSHNGTIRKTLTDPGYPVACDVDPATGDLAVANGLVLAAVREKS